jgi:hypothetical protein
MDREMSGSFHTFMASTSSFPITKVLSCGLPTTLLASGELLGDAAAVFALTARLEVLWAKSQPTGNKDTPRNTTAKDLGNIRVALREIAQLMF